LPGEPERSTGNGYSVNLLRVCGGRKRVGDEYHHVGSEYCNAENITQFGQLIFYGLETTICVEGLSSFQF